MPGKSKEVMHCKHYPYNANYLSEIEAAAAEIAYYSNISFRNSLFYYYYPLYVYMYTKRICLYDKLNLLVI